MSQIKFTYLLTIHVYQIIKNQGHGPYNYLCHADNAKYFMGLSLTQNKREVDMFHLMRVVKKFGDVLAKKKVTCSWLVNSNIVKPEKFNHIHLDLAVYTIFFFFTINT